MLLIPKHINTNLPEIVACVNIAYVRCVIYRDSFSEVLYFILNELT